MNHPAWSQVAQHGLDVAQVVLLAWISTRGVVLPPVNRRTRERPQTRRSRAAQGDEPQG